ncbi:rab-GTPase-TBC domain-containing protein [Hyaloraphidium curvatum]|nr:rab-GTPase-TBC domain-containing protein [Hyaloraphidium curvatum]
MRALRALVLSDGLPEAAEDGNRCGLRGRVWKALLGVQRISAAEYVTLLERKECDAHDKIRNDAFRTLATDKRFTERVGENVLLRVLNAFVWKSRDFAVSRLSPLSFTYVQGMNVLAAPFLFVMPELDAFYSFATFIRDACPLYVQPSLEGAHCAMKLLDICLFTLDPELYAHLRSKGLEAKVYAMAPILTFCACIQPLDEVLVLWDFLLAYGVHLNVLAVVAQLEFFRDELLRSDSPMKHLRSLPPLRGRATIDAIVNRLLPRVPDSLYDMLARHPWDAAVYTVLQTVDGGSSPGGDGLSMGAAELLGCFEVF